MSDSNKPSGTRRPSWPIDQRAKDMLINSAYRKTGWSRVRTEELNKDRGTGKK